MVAQFSIGILAHFSISIYIFLVIYRMHLEMTIIMEKCLILFTKCKLY